MKETCPKIVCLGGGNAMPEAVLQGLKKYPVKLSVVSAMLDSGGSAGRERRQFGTKVAFGDFRRAVLALARISPSKKNLFAYRYQSENSPMKGHVLANIYCTNAVLASSGSTERALKELKDDLKDDLRIPSYCDIFPSTLEDATLCAELENGQIVRGEGEIDIPKHDGNLKIKRVFLEPEAKAYPGALKAIKEADLIVMGPGDLYSSLSQILLVKGISEAVRKSRAKKVYICNLMTKYGETNGYTVVKFANEIEKYLGGLLDKVIYNNRKPSPKRVSGHKKNYPECLEPIALGSILPGKKYLGADLISDSGSICHDPEKLSKAIFQLCRP